LGADGIKAADQVYVTAEAALGVRYQTSDGVPLDYVRAHM